MAAGAATSARLAACESTASELPGASAGAGEAVDRRPAHPAVVADPGFAVGGDPGEERQLPVNAVGLRPITLADLLETPQINRFTGSVDAVGVAIGIHARQQVGAARAVGESRDLCPCIEGQQSETKE